MVMFSLLWLKNVVVTSFPMALIFSIASRNNLSAVFQLKKADMKDTHKAYLNVQ